LIIFIQERVDQEQTCIFISFIVKKEIVFPEEIDRNIPFANSRFDSKIICVFCLIYFACGNHANHPKTYAMSITVV
jgi:hypothetical protein